MNAPIIGKVAGLNKKGGCEILLIDTVDELNSGEICKSSRRCKLYDVKSIQFYKAETPESLKT